MGLEKLSAREREIADLYVRNLSYERIGKKLLISNSTVKQALTRVYKKLGIKGKPELRAFYDE